MNIDKWIDEFLERDKEHREPETYFASEAGDCPRKIYYSVINPKPPGTEARRVFKLGHMIHSFIYSVVESHKDEFDYLDFERRITVTHPEFIINGVIDIYCIKNGKPQVIEIKSIKSFDYLDKPIPKHIVQLQLYLYATRSKVGHLVYVEKTGLQTTYFPVFYKKKIVTQTLKKIAMVNECIKNRMLPERVCSDYSAFECFVCPYKEECMKHESNKTKNKGVSH